MSASCGDLGGQFGCDREAASLLVRHCLGPKGVALPPAFGDSRTIISLRYGAVEDPRPLFSHA